MSGMHYGEKTMKNENQIRSIAHKKQIDEEVYLFEYWEGANTLRATGSKDWVDMISRLLVPSVPSGGEA